LLPISSLACINKKYRIYKMQSFNKLMTYNEAAQFLQNLKQNQKYNLEFHVKKHKIFIFNDDNKKLYEIRLPLPFPSLKKYDSIERYLVDVEEIPPAYYIILIQAGNSSIGYFEEGEVIKSPWTLKSRILKN